MIQEWEQQWLTSVLPSTEVRITRKKYPVNVYYATNGHTLAEADTDKYTGVSLHKNTSWYPHAQAAKKAKICSFRNMFFPPA